MVKKRTNTRRTEDGKSERFGDIAVRMGFCTARERDLALEEQERMDEAGEPHLLLGLVMLKMGTISSEQLIQVLKHYDT